MANFGTIVSRVQARIIDLPQVVRDEVPTLVNAVIRAMQDQYNFSVMESLGGPYTTVVDTRELNAKPSNFKEYFGDPYYQEYTTGKTRPMGVINSRSDMRGYFSTLDRGYPQFLLEAEPSDAGVRTWEVWPLPDGQSDWDDEEYRIYVPYYRYLPALSTDTSTNWFTENAEEYIVYMAQGEAFGVDWDEERMALWLQRGQQKFAEIVKRDKVAKLSKMTTRTFVPHWKGANYPKLRLR